MLEAHWSIQRLLSQICPFFSLLILFFKKETPFLAASVYPARLSMSSFSNQIKNPHHASMHGHGHWWGHDAISLPTSTLLGPYLRLHTTATLTTICLCLKKLFRCRALLCNALLIIVLHNDSAINILISLTIVTSGRSASHIYNRKENIRRRGGKADCTGKREEATEVLYSWSRA